MTTHQPIPPSERVPAPTIAFEPAKLRRRYDGWTAEKQIRFVEALAATKCVDEACRIVGMSDTSAYTLRNRPCGEDFARAWDIALDCQIPDLEQAAMNRARYGVPRPIFYKGEQVGEYRHFDELLTMFLLRSRRPKRYENGSNRRRRLGTRQPCSRTRAGLCPGGRAISDDARRRARIHRDLGAGGTRQPCRRVAGGLLCRGRRPR